MIACVRRVQISVSSFYAWAVPLITTVDLWCRELLAFRVPRIVFKIPYSSEKI